MEEIKEKLPGVELKRTEVQADAAVAEAEAAECLAGKQSVEQDLSVAMPALNAAIKVQCLCAPTPARPLSPLCVICHPLIRGQRE